MIDPEQPSRAPAFALAAAGFTTAVANAQVAWMVSFADPFVGALPAFFVLLGGAGVATAIKLAHPRAWARKVGAALLAAYLSGVPWGLWLLFQGLFTALLVLAPLVAVVAAAMLAVTWRATGRAAALRAIAEAETEKLMREALAGAEAPARPDRPWLLPTLYGAFGLPISAFALVLFAPDTWAWAEVRARALLAGRNPLASTFVAAATDYPYTGSPLAWYLDYEGRFVSLPEDDILAVADAIADDVAWRLTAATGETDPVAAERALWAQGRGRALPLWIAAALRDRHAFYSVESLFSRSFNPDIHVLPETIHLDCDQLVYVFLHVAWRLDLAMSAVPSPLHVYLRYAGPDGEPPLWVETTQFRRIDVNGGRVDFMGRGIGEEFFIDAAYYPSGRGGSWADPAVVSAAGLYQPWTERDIRDSIVANVVAGLRRNRIDAPYVAEMEAALPGTRDLTLVSNLYGTWLETAKTALAAGNRGEARAAAERARAIRSEFGALVIYADLEEEEVLAAVGG